MELTFKSLLENLPPGVRIVEKRGWFWRLLHWLVFFFTLGGNKTFLTRYVTTLGPLIGVPVGWMDERDDVSKLAVLTHELVHVRQCKAFGLGSAWLGLPVFGLLYLLVPLPFGLALFRYRFERSAYVAGIRIFKAYGHDVSVQVEFAVKQLTGPGYGWAFPFPTSVRRYFERELAKPL